MLPGHKYAGPGTGNLNAGPGVDKDDQHAQLHDLAYAAATGPSDILHADEDFVEANLVDPGPHSLLAGAAVGLKTVGERFINSIVYPRMDKGVKRPSVQGTLDFSKHHKAGSNWERIEIPPENPEEEPEAKSQDLYGDSQPEPAVQEDSAAGGATGMNPQPGSSLPGGTGASVVPVSIGSRRGPDNLTTFTKKWQIYTGGFQFTTASAASTTGFADVAASFPATPNPARILMTPFAVIDPNQLPWFLSQAEYGSLAPWAKALSCRIKVVPLGYRLPFATNEASSTFANSQTLVQIASSIGLNHKTNGVTGGFSTDASDLTKPTGRVQDFPNGHAFWYGGTTAFQIGANVGIPRHLNWYWSMIWSPPGPSANSTINETPHLLQHMDIINVNDCKGTPLINYSYDYKQGWLKIPQSATNHFFGGIPVRVQDVGFGINSGSRRIEGTGAAATEITQSAIGNTHTYLDHSSAETYDFNQSYDLPVEKVEWFKSNLNDNDVPMAPPHVNIACMPVQSNAPLSATPTFAQAVVQWEITCEMDVSQTFDYMLPSASIPWPLSFNAQRLNAALIVDYFNALRGQVFIMGRRSQDSNSAGLGAEWGPSNGTTGVITLRQPQNMAGNIVTKTIKKPGTGGGVVPMEAESTIERPTSAKASAVGQRGRRATYDDQ